MDIERCKHRDCIGCSCFLKSCIAVVNVDGVKVKVYNVCCRSCVVGVGGWVVANATTISVLG